MLEEKTKINLSNISFEIFRDFIKSAKEKHPQIDINIYNEFEIVEDFLLSINSAKKALTKKYKITEELKKYQVGFMLGFIRSNLNAKWTYNYIIKQSNQYKEFIAIKAIKIYLNENILDQIKINDLYQLLLTNENNLSEINSRIDNFTIGVKELDELTEKDEKSQVLQMLENSVNRYIFSYMNKNEEIHVWPMEKYFSTEEIMQLINMDY